MSIRFLLASQVLALLSGCAMHYTPEAVADPYGFFSGVWHGIVFPFALLTNAISWLLSVIGISAFQEIQIIGRPNTGLWYYVGLGLGLVSMSGGSAKSRQRND